MTSFVAKNCEFYYTIKLPTPTATNPANAMISHWVPPPVSVPLMAILFVGLGDAEEDVDDEVLADDAVLADDGALADDAVLDDGAVLAADAELTADAGPTLPPWTTDGDGGLDTLAAAAWYAARVAVPVL
jgi:hypothetical protein